MNENDTNKEKINQEIEKEEPSILKPTTSVKEIMDRNKQTESIQLAKRVERYNFKNGFQNSSPINNTKIEEITNENNNEVVSNNRIEIKTKKKTNILLIILIAITLIIVLSILIKQPYKEETSEIPKIENPEITSSPSEIKETICSKMTDSSAFGYNYIQERKLYSFENKIKKYENIDKFEYINTVPATINDACYNINQNYKEYEGYSYTCTKDEKTYSYITKVDLETLLDKELIFSINSNTLKKVITENLDDDINEYIKDYEEQGYSCDIE